MVLYCVHPGVDLVLLKHPELMISFELDAQNPGPRNGRLVLFSSKDNYIFSSLYKLQVVFLVLN